MADKDRSDMDTEVAQGAPGTTPGSEESESAEVRARREARRRILAGGLAGAPLILTLTSRPALASVCSVSGMQSGNLSRAGDVVCQGLTPGYWKTHAQKCSQNDIFVGTCNPITEDNGRCEDYSVPTKEELEAYIDELEQESRPKWWKIYNAKNYLYKLETYPHPTDFFGTPFAEIFGSGYTENPNTTMMQALWLDDTPPLPPDGMGGPSPILAHSAAAWLNAKEFGEETYGLSPQAVIDLVRSMILSDPFGLKDQLEMLNSRS